MVTVDDTEAEYVEISEIALQWLLFVSQFIFNLNEFDPDKMKELEDDSHQSYKREYDHHFTPPRPNDQGQTDVCSFEKMFSHWTKSSACYRIRLIEKIVRIVSSRSVTSTLDLGCGQCNISAFLRHQNIIEGEIVGVDASAIMLEMAKELTDKCQVQAEFIREDISNLSVDRLGKEKFDLVLCLSTLQWCDDWPSAIMRIAEVTALGGLIILEVQVSCQTNPLAMILLLVSLGIDCIDIDPNQEGSSVVISAIKRW